MRNCRQSGAVIALGVILTSAALAGENGHPQTPQLAGLADGTAKLICAGHTGDRNVLDFSGTAYDPLRHKILAFGGGHATGLFPNSVHEFDLRTLKWTQLTEDVPPSAYSVENAVKTEDGKKLGGVKYKGKIHCGSRHTYGGLVILPGTSLMAVGSAMEFIGGRNRMPGRGKFYNDNYSGGSGLWIFDPVKKEWRVSKKAGMVACYGAGAIDPRQPDWIYHFGKKTNHRINWKTEETQKVPSVRLRGCVGVSYNPGDHCFYTAPCSSKVPKSTVMMKLDAAKQSWQALTPTGDAPNTYDTALSYDDVSRVFVCFFDNHAYYYSPGENKWYKVEKPLGNPSLGRTFKHRVSYDPVNNVHILTASRWQTYAFKLSGTPGKLPGSSK
ncbi:MAG: hypothetical protein ACYTGB_04605 [Planctomycetota bacterium]|jgi:hypothetical protein